MICRGCSAVHALKSVKYFNQDKKESLFSALGDNGTALNLGFVNHTHRYLLANYADFYIR